MLFTHFHQILRKHVGSFIYPFLPNVPFLYPLKKSEKFGYLTFSWRIEMDHWVKCARGGGGGYQIERPPNRFRLKQYLSIAKTLSQIKVKIALLDSLSQRAQNYHFFSVNSVLRASIVLNTHISIRSGTLPTILITINN